MDFKDALTYWKSIATTVVFIVVTTYGYFTWAADQEKAAEMKALEERAVVTATQQLIHNDMYQNSRIDRKRDQIKEDKRELDNILEDVGDDEPTPRQARNINELDDSIKEKSLAIEEIEVALETNDE